MEQLRFTVPCLFGLEGLVGSELRHMKINEVEPENGRVNFSGTLADMAQVNLWLRTGERVLLRLGTFRAVTFEALFEGTRALPWERFIPKNGAFPVKGHSLQSTLFSVPDCQSIIKKAVVERLKDAYHVSWFEETGSKYQIQFSIMHDEVSLYLDTSGAGLHKRGYRANANEAPLRETLAAGMVMLSKYRGRERFYDPFCGSGTIAIEAAMIAQNRAPGLYRRFAAETWNTAIPWQDLRNEAKSKIFAREFWLWGGDTDPKSVKLAQENAQKAGVAQYTTFEVADATRFAPKDPTGILVTNPPYGERMLDQKQARALIESFGQTMRQYRDLSAYIISSDEEFEKFYGMRATKRRKLYNGMIKCEFYQYYQTVNSPRK